MASIVVRNLDEHVKRALVERARINGRSMESEAREILANAVAPRNPLRLLHQIAAERDACVELELPERQVEGRELSLP